MGKSNIKATEESLARLHTKLKRGELEMHTPYINSEDIAEADVAYVIKGALMNDIKIRKSANAWWMEEKKVALLIEGFKYGNTIKTACLLSGVSRSMWEYFIQIHPEFRDVIEACREMQIALAMDTIQANLHDPKTARWLLERRHPYFKTRLTMDDFQGSLLSNMAYNPDEFEGKDPRKVASRLRQTAKAILLKQKTKESRVGLRFYMKLGRSLLDKFMS